MAGKTSKMSLTDLMTLFETGLSSSSKSLALRRILGDEAYAEVCFGKAISVTADQIASIKQSRGNLPADVIRFVQEALKPANLGKPSESICAGCNPPISHALVMEHSTTPEFYELVCAVFKLDSDLLANAILTKTRMAYLALLDRDGESALVLLSTMNPEVRSHIMSLRTGNAGALPSNDGSDKAIEMIRRPYNDDYAVKPKEYCGDEYAAADTNISDN